ncbi:hypothetical protein Dfer_5528 [Dyadobacter fermentans DSM 18053]|uniref:Uncharacterized protein n=2 Tax=Dyadobacter fermentans TaxID=94254 RepID=C6VVI9_DYAFD|nr:hypothetical protein Dfer_5528 [Dyadobacter fermentans DSM 18053]
MYLNVSQTETWQQNMEKLVAQLKKIARQHPQGFTVFLPSLEHAAKGWVIALAETQDSFGDEGLRKVIETAQRKGAAVGGWKHEGKFYYDASIIIEEEAEAMKLGRENKQIAIYNIETGKYIKL